MSDAPRKRNFHPSGDSHWTRQPGVERAPWGKLEEEKIAVLCARYQAGETQSDLARTYRIGRTTVWRYLRRAGLIGNGVSSVSRGTA